jgi:hypothetical protein
MAQSKPKPIIKCKYGCETLLQDFDEVERKYLEYQGGALHTADRCRYLKEHPVTTSINTAPVPVPTLAATATAPNPIQRALTNGDKRAEEIREAQRVRKEENDALINAIKNLTVEIINLQNIIRGSAALADNSNLNNESV